jgi:hypothetical protein
MTPKRYLQAPKEEALTEAQQYRKRQAEEWQRQIEWAERVFEEMGSPSPVALLLALREEYMLLNLERLAKRTRVITARMEMERLREEIDRVHKKADELLAACDRNAGPERDWKAWKRYERVSKRWEDLSKLYDKVSEVWRKEAGIA